MTFTICRLWRVTLYVQFKSITHIFDITIRWTILDKRDQMKPRNILFRYGGSYSKDWIQGSCGPTIRPYWDDKIAALENRGLLFVMYKLFLKRCNTASITKSEDAHLLIAASDLIVPEQTVVPHPGKSCVVIRTGFEIFQFFHYFLINL